jgi:Protein of unknown function (DUF3617)
MVMRLIGAVSILVLIGVMPALAAELPSRKPGLWEVKMSFENRNVPGQTMQQCIDASTDQAMQSNMGPYSQGACAKRDIQRSANSITIDSTCTFSGKTTTSHAVVTGSFDSAYTMTMTSQNESVPGGSTTMTMSAKWLGPCAANQKPGDMIMGNGMKMNILDMQRRGPPPGMPAPPPR